MIVVGGFNSSLDKFAEAVELRSGAVNRLETLSAYPGGKGVHVAQACALLGEPVRLVGIIDDRHAPIFERAMASRAIEWRGVSVDKPIRSCYAIRDSRGEITEILEPGPQLHDSDAARLHDTFIESCRSADFAVLSGSLPRGCAQDTYARLVGQLAAMGVPCLVDSSAAALAAAIEARPALLKPNADEASCLTGERIGDVAAAMNAVAALASRGLPRVVISLGKAGAVAAWNGRIARVRTPAQEGISGVGSGDCFAGGLVVGIVQKRRVDDTLRLAAACGAANVLSPEPGFFRLADVERLASDVEIDWA